LDQLLDMTGGATAGHIVSTTANVLCCKSCSTFLAVVHTWCTVLDQHSYIHCTYYALSERSDEFGTHFDSGKTQNTDDEYCIIFAVKCLTKQSTSVKCF